MKRSLKKCKSGWKRELGTSKKAQGIVTPKAPWNDKERRFMLKRILSKPRTKEELGIIDQWIAKIINKERRDKK